VLLLARSRSNSISRTAARLNKLSNRSVFFDFQRPPLLALHSRTPDPQASVPLNPRSCQGRLCVVVRGNLPPCSVSNGDHSVLANSLFSSPNTWRDRYHQSLLSPEIFHSNQFFSDPHHSLPFTFPFPAPVPRQRRWPVKERPFPKLFKSNQGVLGGSRVFFSPSPFEGPLCLPCFFFPGRSSPDVACRTWTFSPQSSLNDMETAP